MAETTLCENIALSISAAWWMANYEPLSSRAAEYFYIFAFSSSHFPVFASLEMKWTQNKKKSDI